jgi:hypothetical protein
VTGRLSAALFFAAFAFAAPHAVTTATVAYAQPVAASEEELAAARKLFAEALEDEQDRRFDVALEKFRQVQKVRSTMAVRYRIASCLDGLGKLRDAERAFRELADAKANDADEADVRSAARDRAAEIARRTPRVVVLLSSHAPADAQVTLDGRPLVGGALRGEAVPVDPGEHEVRGRATGAPDFATRVSVVEHAVASIDVLLDPVAGATPAPARRAFGIAFVSLGVTLAAASIVTVVLRARDLDELNASCPGGACPMSRESELRAIRSRALVEGPLSLVFAGAAALAGGAGLFVLLAPPAGQTGGVAGFSWRGEF